MIKIIWDYELDLPLDKLFNELIDFWKIAFPNLNFSREKVFNDLNEFLVQRIVSHLEEISPVSYTHLTLPTSDLV